MRRHQNLLVCGFYGFLVLVLFLLGGCAAAPPPPVQAAARLSFEDIQPLAVNASLIDIVNQYDPSADPKDVSSLFPAQPDIVLRRYAEKRLAAGGSGPVLRFVIENGRVYHHREASDSQVGRWLQIGGTDHYDVLMRVRLEAVPADGIFPGESTTLNFRRTLGLPESMSIAEREAEQIELLETMVEDIDRGVTDTLRNKMNLAGDSMGDYNAHEPASGDPANGRQGFVRDLLATPEL